MKRTIFSKRPGMYLGLASDTWNVLTLAFLAATAIAAFGLLISQRAVIVLQDEADKASKEKIATLEKATAKSNERAASLERDAEEARLKLEQLRRQIAPRHVRREVFLKLIEGQPKAHTEIMYLRDDPECFDVAQQIWRLLQDAKWDVIPPTSIPLSNTREPNTFSVDGQPSGITVATHSASEDESEAIHKQHLSEPWVKTPWTVLMYALGQSVGKIEGHSGGPNRPKDGTLRVVVAPRLEY